MTSTTPVFASLVILTIFVGHTTHAADLSPTATTPRGSLSTFGTPGSFGSDFFALGKDGTPIINDAAVMRTAPFRSQPQNPVSSSPTSPRSTSTISSTVTPDAAAPSLTVPSPARANHKPLSPSTTLTTLRSFALPAVVVVGAAGGMYLAWKKLSTKTPKTGS